MIQNKKLNIKLILKIIYKRRNYFKIIEIREMYLFINNF